MNRSPSIESISAESEDDLSHADVRRDSRLGRRFALSEAVLIILILLGLLVRLDDLDDLPLDYHPTRQLWSALIARGMYYQNLPSIPEWKRQMAVLQWKSKALLEPRIMERLAATGYRLVGEDALWVPRLFSILFWALAGAPLYFLSRDLANESAALTATAFYLFLPYAVSASRSFQPEPLMISAMIFALWALFRWLHTPTWGWALLAGVLLCLAIFVKGIILFPLLGGMAGLFLTSRGFQRAARDAQVWGIALLALLPNIGYTYYGTFVARFLEGNLNGRFFPELLINPWFYIRWELKINQVLTHGVLILALLGIIFFKSRVYRWTVIGLWLGYLAYGMLLNHQTSTHDYYHLPLIPIAALSLAPLVENILQKIHRMKRTNHWIGLILAGIFFIAVGSLIWHSHVTLHSIDYRGEAAKYAAIQQKLGRKNKVIALTEDYGYRLAYWGWINARIWPSYGDLVYQQKLRKSTAEFQKTFTALTSGMDYFLVTWFEELTIQPNLKEYLFQNYLLVQQSETYLIFDLKHPPASPSGAPR